MLNRTLLLAATFAGTILLVGSLAVPQAHGQNVIIESLSVTAYQRVAPRLTDLKPGDRVQSRFKWRVFEGKPRPIAVADGWVGPFSGGFPFGSEMGFGEFIGWTGELLLGEHLFGYLVDGEMLVPRYVVTTQATVIPEEEYNRLVGEKADNVGFTFTTRTTVNAPGRIEFKDAVVKEVRPLAFSDAPLRARGAPGPTLRDDIRWYASTERFKVAESKLRALAAGMDYWDALAALGMVFVTLDSGLTYRAWLADGYLGAPRSMLTAAGFFKVLRFGYLEGNKEMPQLALIFKNNRVHKLVPHGTLEELMSHFD